MCVLLAFGAAACGGGDGTSAAETAVDATATETTEAGEEAAGLSLEGKTVAYIQTGSFPYYEFGVEGAERMVESLGGSIVVFNSELNPQKELANVQDAITQQVDGVILFPISLAGEKAALRLTDRAGIPASVLYGYDESLTDLAVAFQQVDFEAYGSAIGEETAKLVPAGEVGIITGLLGRGDAEAYSDGFRAGFGDESRIVSELDGEWSRQQALAAAQDMITKHPSLKGIFVQNEDMAAGVVQGLGSKAKDVVVTAMNGSPEGIEMLEKGELAATVGLSPSQEAAMAVRHLAEALGGGVPDPQLCFTPFAVDTEAEPQASVPWPAEPEVIQLATEVPCGG